MFSKAQLKRLTLVLIIPLVATGFWLAEYEVLVENDYMTSCEDFGAHFSCVTIHVSSRRRNQYVAEAGGIFVGGFGRLDWGIDEPVISSGERHMEYRDGKLQEEEVIGAGAEKRLIINRNAGAGYSGNGPCRLGLIKDSRTEWQLWCANGPVEYFRFKDENASKKYFELNRLVQEHRVRFSEQSKIRYVTSLLIPFFCYFAFLIISVLIYKAGLFVRFGKAGKS